MKLEKEIMKKEVGAEHDIVDFQGPTQLVKHLEFLFGNKYRVSKKSKWYAPTSEMDKLPEFPALNVDSFDPKTANDQEEREFLRLFPRSNGEGYWLKIEVDYDWFFKRNLKKKLNWFQIMVGRLVGIL